MSHAPYVGVRASEVHASGERRLLRAMLLDSLRTILAPAGPNRSAWQRKELAWISSRDQRDVFAFEHVCDVLGIDASYLRGRVLAALAKVGDRTGAAVFGTTRPAHELLADLGKE